ncbi:MAG: hypothetical protein RLY31_329 [Bacteroidota bacterium]|jgi:hypothetical protein
MRIGFFAAFLSMEFYSPLRGEGHAALAMGVGEKEGIRARGGLVCYGCVIRQFGLRPGLFRRPYRLHGEESGKRIGAVRPVPFGININQSAT